MSLDDSLEQEVLWPPTNSCNNVDHSLAPVDNNNICKNNINSIIMIWTCLVLQSVTSLPVFKSFSRGVFFFSRGTTRVPATDELRLDAHKITAKKLYFA